MLYEENAFNARIRNARKTILASGNFKLNETGRAVMTKIGGAWTDNWIFTQAGRQKACLYYLNIYCMRFNCIPTHCRFNCWKTVIKPRTVKELFALYEINKRLDLPAKCGIDNRTYTHGHYAGFVYADTLPEGKKYYEIYRKEVDEHISPDVSVILKRGCTEMEKLKQSLYWSKVDEEDILFERAMNDFFCFESLDFYQPKWLRHEIKTRWVEAAICTGDPTAREMAIEFSGDENIWKKIVVESVTYHDRDEFFRDIERIESDDIYVEGEKIDGPEQG